MKNKRSLEEKKRPFFAEELTTKEINIRIRCLEVELSKNKKVREIAGLKGEIERRRKLFSKRIRKEMLK